MAPGCAIILDHSGNIIWYDLREIMLMIVLKQMEY